MKKWFVEHEDLVIEKIFPAIAIVAIVAMMVFGFNPSEWIIPADIITPVV